MTRSRLLLAVAAVLFGAAVLFVVLGTVFNLLLVAAAAPFGLGAYLLWLHATGRLHARVRRRAADRERPSSGRERAWSVRDGPGSAASARHPTGGSVPSMDRREALAALDLSPGASQRAVRRAYRERVKAVHPDADGGDENEFRRVRAAYETLSRGKG